MSYKEALERMVWQFAHRGVIGGKSALHTGGMMPGSLTVIGARPSTGKSQVAQQVAYHNLLNKKSVLFASAEMRLREYDERWVAMELGIPPHQQDKLDEAQWNKLNSLLADLHKQDFYFIDQNVSSDNIARIARKVKDTKRLDLVVVDYLQILKDSNDTRKGENLRLRVKYACQNLKEMAKELNVAVLALSQISRSAEMRDAGIPQMADLKESGSIEEDADNVLLLHRPELYKIVNDVDSGVMWVYIKKNRRMGNVGKIGIKWDGQYRMYRDMAHT